VQLANPDAGEDFGGSRLAVAELGNVLTPGPPGSAENAPYKYEAREPATAHAVHGYAFPRTQTHHRAIPVEVPEVVVRVRPDLVEYLNASLGDLPYQMAGASRANGISSGEPSKQQLSRASAVAFGLE
jgi:hypothetical protein